MDAAAIQPTPCDQSPIFPEAVKLNFASMLLQDFQTEWSQKKKLKKKF